MYHSRPRAADGPCEARGKFQSPCLVGTTCRRRRITMELRSPQQPAQPLFACLFLWFGMLVLMSDGFLHNNLMRRTPHVAAGLPRRSSSASSPSSMPSLDNSPPRQQQDELQSDATLSNQSFSELYEDDIPQWLLEKCEDCGFKHPTLIQKRALDCFFQDEPNSMVIQVQV